MWQVVKTTYNCVAVTRDASSSAATWNITKRLAYDMQRLEERRIVQRVRERAHALALSGVAESRAFTVAPRGWQRRQRTFRVSDAVQRKRGTCFHAITLSRIARFQAREVKYFVAVRIDRARARVVRSRVPF